MPSNPVPPGQKNPDQNRSTFTPPGKNSDRKSRNDLKWLVEVVGGVKHTQFYKIFKKFFKRSPQ